VIGGKIASAYSKFLMASIGTETPDKNVSIVDSHIFDNVWLLLPLIDDTEEYCFFVLRDIEMSFCRKMFSFHTHARGNTAVG
jgi:hypothetical protein